MTVQEIQQAIGANPALVNEIAQNIVLPVLGENEELIKAAIPSISKKGYKIRTETDEQSFLDSFKNQVIETEIPARIKEVHDRYDADLFELTGKRKQPAEKTYDFLKREITELKNSQIADPVTKERIKALEAQLETKQTEFKKELEAVENKYFKRELEMSIGAALDNVNIALPAQLKTDEEKEKYIKAQRSMMKRDMLELVAKKDNEGNIVFYDKEKPLTSNENGKPLTPSDIIKDRYGLYIAKDEGRKMTGAGTGGNNGSGDKAFQNKEAIIAHLTANGVQQGTKDFYTQYEKLCKESGLL